MAERQKDDSVLIDEIKLDEEKSDEILAKYDREFAYRRLEGPVAKFVFLLAVAWSLAHLYTAAFGVFPSTIQRAPHVGIALVLIFIMYPAKRGSKSNKVAWYD
nr:C4-dicarboxylate ABC transporter permease [Bacillota bacterium]